MPVEAYCLWCGSAMRQQTGLAEMFWQSDVLCFSCRQKLQAHKRCFRLGDLKVTGLYVYRNEVRNLILQYKEMNDEALFPVLLWPYAEMLKRHYRNWLVVPIPSSRQANIRRGFQTVERMFSVSGLIMTDLLEKTDDYQQKTQPYTGRKMINEHLRLIGPKPKALRLLLVDDIVTSGATVIAAAKLLKPYYSHIEVLTVAYSQRYLSPVQLKWEKLIKERGINDE